MTMREMIKGCVETMVAASTLACGGSTSSTDASTPTFTGDVPGTDVKVGVIATDQRARVFFCGGATSYQTRTRWLTTDIETSGKIDVSKEMWRLDAQLGNDEFSGTIDMGDGVVRPFRATLVRASTIAGLYEGLAPCGRLGLIVSQSSAEMPATGQGACVGTTFDQVNPLSPIVRAPDGTIRVTVGSTATETVVSPAAAPAP